MTRFLIAGLLVVAACQPRLATETADTSPASTPARTVPDAPLRETRWVLRQLGGAAVTAANGREAYLLLRATGRAEGDGGCNRFGGDVAETPPEQLQFGALFSTKMACLDAAANATETTFMKALNATRRYRISGDTLRLYDEGGTAPLARLEAVYLR